MDSRNNNQERSAAASFVSEKWPARPVTLTLPFPLGRSTGYTATVLARALESLTGQSFAVEPHTGHFGINALQHLIQSPAGAVLLVGNLTSNSMTPVFHRDKMNFDYFREIAPVTKLADFPSVAMTQLSFPADTLADFLAHLRRTSGHLVYGTDFLGAYVDVDAINLGAVAGLRVAYHATDGASGILADLLAGRTDIAFINVATAIANVGKFKPLAVYGTQRLTNFPDVPTMAEAGYPIEGYGWNGIFVPAGTPAPLIARLQQEISKVLADKEIQEDAQRLGTLAGGEKPEEFAEFVRGEVRKWGQVIKDANIKIE